METIGKFSPKKHEPIQYQERTPFNDSRSPVVLTFL